MNPSIIFPFSFSLLTIVPQIIANTNNIYHGCHSISHLNIYDYSRVINHSYVQSSEDHFWPCIPQCQIRTVSKSHMYKMQGP